MVKSWEAWAFIAVVVIIVAVGVISFMAPITSGQWSPRDCVPLTPSGAGCV